ncbi:MAG: VWA domain-containing protein [Ignavibacteriales bacterium]|nr:VWA domain-containing protein [Ignavibacteriales bacterium]
MPEFGSEFAYPWVLAGLAIVPLLAAYRWFFGRKREMSVVFSNMNRVYDRPRGWRERLAETPVLFRLLAIAALIVALARPQTFNSGEDVTTEGIDIVVALDISGSMKAMDFKPNRLKAAKEITDEFIKGRTSDRIGLVVFARSAFTQCPLTLDYSALRNLLKDVYSGMIEDGTAIGNAIANGVNRLKDSDAKSKAMILLTDGVSNAGEVDPLTAAEIAKNFDVRIYAVGVGTRGEAPYPYQTPFGLQTRMVPVEIDEPTLKRVAETTGGTYFRATSNKKLEEIYKEIDSMEKTRISVTSYRNKSELFYGWLFLGLAFLAIELTLSKTVFRTLP